MEARVCWEKLAKRLQGSGKVGREDESRLLTPVRTGEAPAKAVTWTLHVNVAQNLVSPPGGLGPLISLHLRTLRAQSQTRIRL